MKTNDVILFGVGLAVGYFVKSSLDKRNAVATTQVGDENYVFSQKYKDCEQKVSTMTLPEGAGIDYRKKAIDECMNGKGVPVTNEGKDVQAPKQGNSKSNWLSQLNLNLNPNEMIGLTPINKIQTFK